MLNKLHAPKYMFCSSPILKAFDINRKKLFLWLKISNQSFTFTKIIDLLKSIDLACHIE